ncbi:MAG: hypothetical protein H6550_16080 [Chitinophagales bacterium]|nr:hypothetical protein [Chitinophagales bacterium]
MDTSFFFDFIQGLINSLLAITDTVYLVAFMLFSYMAKDGLNDVLSKVWYRDLYITGKRASKHWTVAIIGILVALPFFFIPALRHLGTDELTVAGADDNSVYGFKLAVTFGIGTTFYDTILCYVIKLIKKVKTDK